MMADLVFHWQGSWRSSLGPVLCIRDDSLDVNHACRTGGPRMSRADRSRTLQQQFVAVHDQGSERPDNPRVFACG
ncbi:hypothetical protein AKJ16_DCAP07864 [Drosera capensis]